MANVIFLGFCNITIYILSTEAKGKAAAYHQTNETMSDYQVPEEIPPTNRKKTSWVWDHFEETADGNKAKCKHCHKDRAKHTGAMRKHLKSEHNLEKGSQAGLAGIVKLCH
jgi:hypothetical protein